MFAIIGGSGLAALAGLLNQRREAVRTPYGDPSGPLTFGEFDACPVVFLARHGYGHTMAPHEINYRANLWALKQAGATSVVSVATVGGIRADMGPGTLVVPDQLIDYTWGRRSTYFEGSESPVRHIDFTEPYDADIRSRVLAAARELSIATIDGATYGCTQGPRLETAAEIRRLQRDGCDLVGMTNMPEATLARELLLPYAALAVVVNYAAGTGDSVKRIELESIAPVMERAMAQVRDILARMVRPT